MIVKAGSANVSVYYYIVQDASGTSPGEPVTGLLFSDIETGGSASFMRQGAARVDLTLITLASASATHADGGFILVDDANMPGLYRCDYPDAAFVTGVDQTFCQIVVASANNAVAAPILIDIDDNVDQTGDSFGRIGVNGAGLTNIDLPNQTMDITGSLSGSVGSVTADVGITQAGADKAWSTTIRLLTAATNITTDNALIDNDGIAANGVAIAALNDVAATDIVSAGAITTLSGAIVNVDLVDTTTTNSDMRGTDSAATAAALAIVDGIVDAILVDTGTTIPALIAALNDLSAAQVNAEVLDVLTVDTFAEPGGVPAATASLKDKIGWLMSLSRNKLTQTSTIQTLRNDADSGNIATAAVSDDTTTFVRNEFS